MFFAALAVLPGAPSHAQAPLSPGAAPPGRVIDLRIAARKAEGGVRTVRVARGEPLVIRIRSDEKLAVHVHGYDVRADVKPGASASLALVARHTGRFPVTAHLDDAKPGRHGAEPTLLYLEVHPE
jgi:siroheme synthase